MCLLRWFLFFDVIFYCFIPVDLISQYPIILIISYDAFRFDYLSKGMSPVASQLRDKGAFAEYMDNVFVTKTFPNHHSLATGVYPEFHGVLGNSVYDNKYKRQLNYSYEFWHYSDEILPIWIANEKKGEGRHSGIMMWPGNEYEYGGIRPTHQKAWSYKITWDQRVDEVVRWILDPEKPANLILLYIEEPDYHGHSFGADSQKLLQELKVLDNITNYILHKLNENNLTNLVNVFFLADHGMLSVTKKDVIDLRNIVSSDLYDKYEGSPALHIYPKPGKANDVYNALKHAVSNGAPFHVYKKSDIPDRWHFKNNRRAPPILAVADPPHVFHDFYPYIEDLQKQWNFTAGEDTPFGIHGYDNQVKLMKPYFLAVGPDIKQNFKIEPFRTIDLFSLWAHMSGFPEYARKTNGSFTIVSKMLKDPEKSLTTLMMCNSKEIPEIQLELPPTRGATSRVSPAAKYLVGVSFGCVRTGNPCNPAPMSRDFYVETALIKFWKIPPVPFTFWNSHQDDPVSSNHLITVPRPVYGLNPSDSLDSFTGVIAGSECDLTAIEGPHPLPDNHRPCLRDIGGTLLGCILLGTAVIVLIFTGFKKWRFQKLVLSRRFREESAESRQRLLDNEEET